jgi:hypothetical protein
MSNEEQYELRHELNGGVDAVNRQLELANQVDQILANINPYTVRSVIHSLVHQHPEVANTMLEELDYYKQSGTI